MRTRRSSILLVALALTQGLAAPTATANVVERKVSFEVENVNRSHVPCPSDGRRYTVSGRLVAPRAALRSRPRAATLYLHGLGYGEFYWRFRAVPGYDFARAQARAGLASVVVDRLGYDASSHPQGNATCVGSQADIAHQIVTALREGGYRGRSGPGPRFARVALAGHSIGSLIAQIEAYSFGGIDALVITAYSDGGQAPLLALESTRMALACASGGQAAEGGGARGYAYFGQTPEDSRAMMHHDASPAVIAAAAALRNLDPCGLIQSAPQALVANQLELGDVAVPVLIVCAGEDALFPQEGCARQRDLYRGSSDASTEVIAGAGHALTLERPRRRFQAAVSAWLGARGL